MGGETLTVATAGRGADAEARAAELGPRGGREGRLLRELPAAAGGLGWVGWPFAAPLGDPET